MRGLAWTTETTVAERFAAGGRFPAPSDPVVASGEVAKQHIFFAQTSRKENELVLDPSKIERLRLETTLMTSRSTPQLDD